MNCDTGEIIKLEDLPEEARGAIEAYQSSLSRIEQLNALGERLDGAAAEDFKKAADAMMEKAKPYLPIEEAQLPKLKHQSRARRKNWMRNKPCPCKSGKKFKKCCWGMFTD